MCATTVAFLCPTPSPSSSSVGAGGEEGGVVFPEKFLQMYADVHRVLLAMAEDYPQIEREAVDTLKQFIENPRRRSRRNTPDLGDLIVYLSVTDQVLLSFSFYFILFYFILFYFILFYFILFYFILFYFILFYFILFYFILFYFILFYFILFYFILFYFILFYFIY